MKKYYISGFLLSVFLSLSMVSAQATGDASTGQSRGSCTDLSYNLTYKKSKDSNTNGEVSRLQAFLKGQGLRTSGSNGVFGAATLRDVKYFQGKYGFVRSGYVGPALRLKIKSLSCGGGGVISSTGGAGSINPTTSETLYNCSGVVSREPCTNIITKAIVPASGNILGEVDVFLVAGQSNAVGYGSASASPVPGKGKVFKFINNTLSDGVDPFDPSFGVDNGSAWPSFGIKYNSVNGHIVIFVPSAVPGSSQIVKSNSGNGSWEVNGTLFNSSLSKLDNAVSKLRSLGYTVNFKGVLWNQGETDAIAINKGIIGVDEYRTAFTEMISGFRSRYGSSIPFYIFQTGTSPNESDLGYSKIRESQNYVAFQDSNTKLVFKGAYSFSSRGLMWDSYHYKQAGYNEMGSEGAANVVSGNDLSVDNTPTVTASFTPSSISSTGTSVFVFNARNASYCNVSHPDGTNTWNNAPTAYSGAVNASAFQNGLITDVVCYNSAGVASTPVRAVLTVTKVLGVSTICVDIPRNLHRGIESSSVSVLQKFLQSNGFLSENPTAFYGDKTVEAVKDYQASKGLPETGMVYDFTRQEIMSETCR